MTENWLLHFRRGGLWIVRVDDILWAYKRINVRSTFLGGGRLQFTVCVSVDRGRPLEIIVGREAAAHQMLEQIIRRRPAILVGYQMTWHDLAKEGIAALRGAVCERETQWASLSEDDQFDWLEDRSSEASEYVYRHDPRLHGN